MFIDNKFTGTPQKKEAFENIKKVIRNATGYLNIKTILVSGSYQREHDTRSNDTKVGL